MFSFIIKKRISYEGLMMFCLLALACPCYGGVIFEEKFDSQADWTYPDDRRTCGENGEDCAALGVIPPGWTYYYAAQLWDPPNHKMIYINTTTRHGNGANDATSGKALIVYNDSASGNSGWGGDGDLSKVFPQDYQELYVRFWLRTQANFRWDTTNDMMIKMFRAGHWDRTGNFFQGFPSGYLAPIYLWDYKHSNTWGTRQQHSFRCDPQATVYYCDSDDPNPLFVGLDSTVEPNASGLPADTKWHRFDFHLKMNTQSGSIWNSDGVLEFWYDGTMEFSKTDLAWKRSGSSPSIGWNYVQFGGNAMNIFAPESEKQEQWYAMDDIVVSTTLIPDDYIIGGGSGDTTPPAAPRNLRLR